MSDIYTKRSHPHPKPTNRNSTAVTLDNAQKTTQAEDSSMTEYIDPLDVLGHLNDPKKRLHHLDVKRKAKQDKPAKKRPVKPKGKGFGSTLLETTTIGENHQ